MTSLHPARHPALRRGMLLAPLAAVLAVVFGLLAASPAAAHAELVSSDPANGARLETAPAAVTMRFTESVNLIPGSIRLVRSDGRTVRTPDPTVDGHTVRWTMPARLANGAYVVSWRVVSSDGHPVAGAFSFGVGTAAVTTPATQAASPSAATAPWQVVTARLAGYLAFSVLAGVFGFLLWCAPGARPDPALQLLTRVALVGGMAAAVVAVLVQGPYTAGVSATRMFNPWLIRDTATTPFGTAMLGRLALYVALLVLAWRLTELLREPMRWLVPAGLAAVAVTIAAAGHGAASGPLGLALVTVHVLGAGIWVGGLVVLVVLGRSVEHRAWRRFSQLAMTSVLVVAATGALNSLRHVHTVEQLFVTRYGLMLVAKLALVAAVVAVAAVSRRRVRERRAPLRSVRAEAALAVGVLTVTALLSMTTPPRAVPAAAAATTTRGSAAANAVVRMSLPQGRAADLAVLPAGTRGSRLRLFVSDRSGQPLRVPGVGLKVTSPARGVNDIAVPMTRSGDRWVTRFTFPFPGRWKVILTVEDTSGTAIVTTGELTVHE